MNKNKYPKCHIYSQNSWHDEAYIIGEPTRIRKVERCTYANIREGEY